MLDYITSHQICSSASNTHYESCIFLMANFCYCNHCNMHQTEYPFFPLLLLSLDGFCQPEGELGILGGMGYYMGEYNPNRHFDRSQRYLGGFCRYNLNDRFALRLNAGFSKIDIRERSLLSNGETVYPAGFHCTVKDVAAWIEFDFRSFGCRK